MPQRTYTVKFEGDASRLTDAIDRLVTKLEALDGVARQAGQGVKEIGKAAGETSGQAERSTSDVDQMTAAFTRLGGAALVLSEVRKAMDGLAQANREAWEYAEKVAQEHIKLRDSMRELAALQGKATPGEGDVSAVAKLALGTGANMKQATDFAAKWANTLDPAMPYLKALKPEQIEDVKRQSLTYAVRRNIAPNAFAEMMLASAIGAPVGSPEEWLARGQSMGRMAEVGVEDPTQIIDAMKRDRSLVRPEGGGAFRSAAELGAAVATETLMNPAKKGATELFSAWATLTRPKAVEKNRLEGLDMFQRLQVAKRILDEGRAKGQDDTQTLTEAGFTDQRGHRAILNLTQNLDSFERWSREEGYGMTEAQRADLYRKKAAALAAGNEEFLRSPTGQARMAAAEKEIAGGVIRGGDEEAAYTAMQRAESRMVAGKQLHTGESNTAEWLYDKLNPMGWLTGTHARDRAVRRQAALQMLTEAQRTGAPSLGRILGQINRARGLPGVELPPGVAAGADMGPSAGYLSSHHELFSEIARTLAPEIEDKGGDPYGRSDEIMRALESRVPAGRGLTPARGDVANPAGGPVKVEAPDLRAAAATIHAAGKAIVDAVRQPGGLPAMQTAVEPWRH